MLIQITMKDLVAVLTTFCKKCLQNLKYSVKRAYIFSFDVGWYSLYFDIVHYELGLGLRGFA